MVQPSKKVYFSDPFRNAHLTAFQASKNIQNEIVDVYLFARAFLDLMAAEGEDACNIMPISIEIFHL